MVTRLSHTRESPFATDRNCDVGGCPGVAAAASFLIESGSGRNRILILISLLSVSGASLGAVLFSLCYFSDSTSRFIEADDEMSLAEMNNTHIPILIK